MKFKTIFIPKLSNTDTILFAKRLSFLLGAGIPLQKAMDIASSQSRRQIQPILKSIALRIHTGESLSSCLAGYPRSFPFYMIRLVKAGEESGQLKQSLEQIAHEIERRKLLKQKILSASLYPCVIVFGTVCLSLFLIFIIFPKIRTLFQSLHMKLPITTRIVIGLSDAVQHFGLLLCVFVALIIAIIFYALKKSEVLQRKKDSLLLSIPGLGSLFRHYILSSFLRTTGLMFKAHIPIDTSLRYAADGIQNKIYSQAILEISGNITAGKTISGALRPYPKLFPDTTVQLIEIGEMSGNLSETLLYLSDMLDQEVDTALKIMVTLIEPALMVGMGIVVGFISLSIITPIYEITQNIRH